MKELLFSLTKKDFEIQTFCTGGNGGQHRNAKQNGVRIIHTASGARAEHRDGRDQAKNKMEAFKKLVETPVFKRWHTAEIARQLGKSLGADIVAAEVERRVLEQMKPEYLKVETYEPSRRG